jgi:hypoxanthine phosphoribosyltransferase
LFIDSNQLNNAIDILAEKVNNDYAENPPIFLCVLNGSFMFASELIKRFNHDCKVSFIKLSSYEGVSSTGKIQELIGINESLNQKDVIIVEDIVDTGLTVANIIKKITKLNPKSIEIATLLYKPKAYKEKNPIKYSAIDVGNEFLVGFGLDYDGFGRNLEEIYIID